MSAFKYSLVVFLLLIFINGNSQTGDTDYLYNKCSDSLESKYDNVVLGNDTLKYFICHKWLSHYTSGNIKCYEADVISPELSKKKKDVKTHKLAMYLMYKYDLYGVRVFKTCRSYDLARMSIRPADSLEQAKIERYIKRSIKHYQRTKL